MIGTDWRWLLGDLDDPSAARRRIVLPGASSLLHYSFDDERDEVTVTCPGCGCSSVTPYHPEPGQDGPTLEHEWDCQVLTLIESVNQGGLFGN